MSVGNVTTKYLLPRNPVSAYAKGYDIFAFETNYDCNVPKFRRESDKASIGLDVVQNQEKKMVGHRLLFFPYFLLAKHVLSVCKREKSCFLNLQAYL